MSTIARLVAIQGIGLTPIAMAVQGLLDGAFVDTAPAVREFRAPIVGRGPGTTLSLSDYKRLFSPGAQAMQMDARQKQERQRRAKRRRHAINHALLRASGIF